MSPSHKYDADTPLDHEDECMLVLPLASKHEYPIPENDGMDSATSWNISALFLLRASASLHEQDAPLPPPGKSSPKYIIAGSMFLIRRVMGIIALFSQF